MSFASALRKILGFDNDDEAKPQTVQARLFTSPPLAVENFVPLDNTPGWVGICLSGGGSRALTGGMGQLRGLRYLKTADGQDLISQARVLSTVSGGSWVGVTFEYLTEGTSDDAYLNELVADLSRLVPTTTDGHSVAETLDALPAGNIGQSIAARSMGPVLLALEVLLLHRFAKVPTPFLWQTAIGLHILKPYGLFEHGRHLVPISLFSYDEATLARDVTGPNPDLAGTPAHLIATGSGRSRRPFLLCNLAMFLEEPNTSFQLLAPVQSTAFQTGIVGQPLGTDFNGKMPGGGGVSSFAFSSVLKAVDGDAVSVEQTRQLALMDIVGTSSAFYAEVLENLFAEWRDDVDKLLGALLSELDELIRWVDRFLPGDLGEEAMEFLKKLVETAEDLPLTRRLIGGELVKWINEIRDLDPKYLYWPVRDAAPDENLEATRFADGGDLENTGVASLLAYSDVDRVISFVNSSQPMGACSLGAFDAEGNEIPGTRVRVDTQMAVLFGYQPWQEGKGYRLYAGDSHPAGPEYQHNQVFPAAAFVDFLRGLWAVTGNTGDPASLGAKGKNSVPGVNLHPPVLRQELEVLANPWFGVEGGKKVTVLWSYTNRVKSFYDALTPEVQAILGDFDDPKAFDEFPHYSTVRTHLSPTQINLLASLTAYNVVAPETRQLFLDLFAPA